MYLFDTNSVSELALRVPNRSLVERFFATAAHTRFISAVVLQEPRFGACLHPQPSIIWQKVQREILPFVRVLEFDEADALVAGELQAELKKSGGLIGMEDIQIAATGLRRGLTVVTRNARHFERVPRLKLENWFV